MPNESTVAIDRESLHLKLDPAWRWFALLTKHQEITFHYFLVSSGIFANSYGLLVREELWWAAIVAESIGCTVGLVLWELDTDC